MYGFLLNMWVRRKIDEEYLNEMVLRKRITSDERDMILSTPQIAL